MYVTLFYYSSDSWLLVIHRRGMNTAVLSSLLDRPLFKAPAGTREVQLWARDRRLLNYYVICYLKYRYPTWGEMTERRLETLRTRGRIAAGCWPGFPRRRCWGRIQAGNIRPVPPWETGWDSGVCRPSGTGSSVVWCLRYSFLVRDRETSTFFDDCNWTTINSINSSSFKNPPSSSCWGSWRWRCLRSPSPWDFPLRRSWHFRRRWRWTTIAIGPPAGKESATATWGSAAGLKVLKRTIWIRNKIF